MEVLQVASKKYIRQDSGTTNLQIKILNMRRDLVERLKIASEICSVLNKYTTGYPRSHLQ